MLRSSLVIWSSLCISIFFVFWLPSIVSYESSETSFPFDSWFVRLCLNLLGYATIIVPGYLILQYVKRNTFNEQLNPKLITNFIRICFIGTESEKEKINNQQAETTCNSERSTIQEATILIVCVVGLQGSYLIWGILQEKIMTKDYISSDGVSSGSFTDSQFLVFVNRILAFVLSGFYILITIQPRHTIALYKYSYCSFSNIMSSWCQYEALKYVSFPTQVLTKASKIIPVMIMGKIVSKKSYDYYEYVTAIIISLGMAMFLMGSTEEHKKTTETTFSGIVILIGYMIFDSFTSNWQSELYTQYKMSSVQMMCAVNLFSCLFTAVSLLQQGGFILSFQFMITFPKFILDIIVLSLCSATGQLFLFYTISQFGPVVFVIIMTVRQCLAILLSCIIYNHPVDAVGIFGISFVFMAIFIRIYCSQRIKALRKKQMLDTALNRV